MGIIWNEQEGINNTSDSFNHYNGSIAIEVRGSSSQSFPKKSFGFETKDESGKDLDFPLLGLPEEEDWIFYGPYSDKSLIRNALTFTLARSLGHYTSRFRFVELFLNNNYQGVYLLMEKIKRDKVRLNIDKLNPDETSGEDLTGGYIIKIDKTTGSGGSGWQSQYLNRNGTKTFYQYEVPSADEIAGEQMQYIQDYIKAFEKTVVTQQFKGAGSYHDYIDASSFIDYILLSELTKNVDAYRLSTFLHKDKNGKLKAGPVWDFNLAYGNANYYDAWSTSGFQIETRIDGNQGGNPFWWKGLWGDTAFVNQMRCKWKELRLDHWSYEQITEAADSLVNVLQEAAVRNFERWPVLGQYVWPNYYVAPAYDDEIFWMKNWLKDRLEWLDANLPGTCGEESKPVPDNLEAVLYPNPVRSEIYIKTNSITIMQAQFRLSNLNGAVVYEQQLNISPGEQILNINAADLPPGIYIYHIGNGAELLQKGKLVKLK